MVLRILLFTIILATKLSADDEECSVTDSWHSLYDNYMAPFFCSVCDASDEVQGAACDWYYNSAYLWVYSGWSAEVRAAAVKFSATRFHQVFSHWEPEVQVQINKSIGCNYFAWFNVGFLWDRGRATGKLCRYSKTRLSMVPVSMGLGYYYPINCNLGAYAGFGPSFTVLRLRDYSPFVHHKVNRQSWGYVVKCGIRIKVMYANYADIFCDYESVNFTGPRNNDNPRVHENLGGIRVGAALGIYY